MKDDELQERRRLNEISNHAIYFLAACVMKSVNGGGKALNIDPKTVCNHIKWLARLTGKTLFESGKPGRTIELTPYGQSLMNEFDADFDKTIRMLDANKQNDVVGSKYVETIKLPFVSR